LQSYRKKGISKAFCGYFVSLLRQNGLFPVESDKNTMDMAKGACDW
jgi:hypothetical protein